MNVVSIRAPSRRVILRPLFETRIRITVAPTSMMRSMTSKLLGVMVPKRETGRPRTMQMLKILLPMMLPTRSSFSPRLAALIVVMSSGREVPKATTVRAMRRSEMPMLEAMVEAELTTSSEPPTTPARPTRIRRREILSLNLGFSISLACLRFLRAREMI